MLKRILEIAIGVLIAKGIATIINEERELRLAQIRLRATGEALRAQAKLYQNSQYGKATKRKRWWRHG